MLVVDDDNLIRTMLSDFLTEAGYSVDTAEDAKQALERLAEPYDAVLSDIMMPGVSGIQLLQQVRARNPQVGVFLLTAHPKLETMHEARRSGAIAYFKKPLKLEDVDKQLRTFLGEDTSSRIEGRVLVVGQELQEHLGARLARFETLVCEPEETAFTTAVGEQQPRAVLADAADAGTPALLQAYRKLGHSTGSFLLVADEDALDAANELLFQQGAAGCIPRQAPQAEVEQQLIEVLEREESQGAEGGPRFEGLIRQRSLTCSFAKAYRNGYFCLSQGGCPFGPYRGGWIAIEGKEFQKCLKRPLLVDSLEAVGVVAWEGRIEAARTPELRRQLLELVRERKQQIIIDAQGLEASQFNLFEILTDVSAEFRRVRPDGAIHIINLTENLLSEFTKVTVDTGIHCAGPRMVDEKATFKRWRSRFE